MPTADIHQCNVAELAIQTFKIKGQFIDVLAGVAEGFPILSIGYIDMTKTTKLHLNSTCDM